MIKTIDTEVVTEDMIYEMKVFESNKELAEEVGIKAILEAAPEVKAEPVAWRYRYFDTATDHWFLTYCNSYTDLDNDPDIEDVQPLYIHPPAVSDVVERIRALLKVIPEYASVNGHQLIYDIIRRIEGAK